MKQGIRKKLYFLSICILSGILFVGYNVFKSNKKHLDAEHWVKHTEQVIGLSGKISSLGQSMESMALRFIITKDSGFLQPLLKAETIKNDFIQQFHRLVADNPLQQERVDSLNGYLDKLLVLSHGPVSPGRIPGTPDGTTSCNSCRLTDSIQRMTNIIQEEENKLLEKRKRVDSEGVIRLNPVTTVIFFVLLIFAIFLIIAVGYYFMAQKEKETKAAELVVAYEELAFQNAEKESRAAELVIANKELAFQNAEKENRAAELVIANKELAFQNEEKENRAAELVIANKELAFQNEEKENRAAELVIANKELAFQNAEKENRAAELLVANKELAFQNEEKESRAAELVVANKELAFQNAEKESRAAELLVANKELAFQNEEKESRASELAIANKELKKVKDDVYKLNEELEEKVVHRTSQLESANKELESFSYSVSHDLRAPLRAINGFAKMLKRDHQVSLDPEANRLMDIIVGSTKKMGLLIDELLNFSRLGRKELIMEEVSMQSLATNICEEIKAEEGNRHIVFSIDDLLPACADQASIRQVWLNLISNAVKYSRKKSNPVIELGAAENGTEIIYHVKDNGAGFDMRYADKLFGVFQRLHSDDEFEGIGVGLAIVHRIVTKHGGRVWAEGKVNEGAVFYFTLKNIYDKSGSRYFTG